MSIRRAVLTLALALCAAAALATPIVPQRDDEVIDTLPAVVGDRARERLLRRQLAAQPRDPKAAVAIARHYMDQARELGDPRFAGQAMAALRAWPDAATAPEDVLLLQATVQQYLHDFDGAAAKLELLVGRNPADAQAWLTLATIRRVQGRYDVSDAACEPLLRAGAALYASACRAENNGLRGRWDLARSSLQRLLADPRLPAPTRNWLLTTQAELEARAGRPAEADGAYRAALKALSDAYTRLSYADFLIERNRDADALAVLKGEPRNDAVLLRLAIAGSRAKTADGAADAKEMRERIALANERPDARVLHAREQAMFALWVDGQTERALALARTNVGLQREPIDLLVLAHAARASGQADALREAAQLRTQVGMVDRRLDALL